MKKNELEFFRKILNERKEQIIQNINSSVDDIRGLKDSSDASDEIDVASVDTDTTLGYAMIQKLSQELKEIDESLGKINAKTYGVCEMCEEEKRVMNQFMPGPLTMILKKKKGVPSFVNGGKDTIAIRLATSPILAEMIGKLGVPVYMTSANVSGEPAALTVEDVPGVKAALAGRVEFAQASTIVFYGEIGWKVLRQGPILLQQIQEATSKGKKD